MATEEEPIFGVTSEPDAFTESFDRVSFKVKTGFALIAEFLFKILAFPLVVIAWIIEGIRSRRYDPTKEICPCCAYNQSTIKFIRTMGPERGAQQHYCLRCGCEEWYTPLAKKGDQWLAEVTPASKADQIRQIQKRGVL